jgi:hypothetical protein
MLTVGMRQINQYAQEAVKYLVVTIGVQINLNHWRFMNVSKDKARQDYWDQQSQDTEGGVADSVSYIMGHIAGQQYLLDRLKELESDNEELRHMLRTLTQEL